MLPAGEWGEDPGDHLLGRDGGQNVAQPAVGSSNQRPIFFGLVAVRMISTSNFRRVGRGLCRSSTDRKGQHITSNHD